MTIAKGLFDPPAPLHVDFKASDPVFDRNIQMLQRLVANRSIGLQTVSLLKAADRFFGDIIEEVATAVFL